jgi:hypothetical protein
MEDTPDHGFRTQMKKMQTDDRKIDVCYVTACFSLGMLAFPVGVISIKAPNAMK